MEGPGGFEADEPGGIVEEAELGYEESQQRDRLTCDQRADCFLFTFRPIVIFVDSVAAVVYSEGGAAHQNRRSSHFQPPNPLKVRKSSRVVSHPVALSTVVPVLLDESHFRHRRYPKHFKCSWPCRPLSLETLIGDGHIQPLGRTTAAESLVPESQVSPVDTSRLLTAASKLERKAGRLGRRRNRFPIGK